ncbi:MAG: UDP-N-acetylmuramate dehydrogenase [Bdellovibrionota bacterium]
MSENSLLQKNISLKKLNWWKVGGEAEYFAAPENLEDLKSVYGEALKNKWPVHILSGGSNILVKEGLIKGLVLSLHALKGVISQNQVNGRLEVVAWAGAPKAEVARVFMQNKLAPAVFMTGIPGDLGGGVVMNAGVGEAIRPREFCEIVDWIEVLRPDLNLEKIESSKIKWEYRHTSGWQPGIIVRVGLGWTLEPDAEVLNNVRKATQKRVQSQPLDMPSGGSTFQNPPGEKAARLIDQCGLKGRRVGGASVSTKHANFIVNDQNAKADDILALIKEVQNEVKVQKSISLQTEVILFGGWEHK